ncbi:hypothetical protein BGZ61DRAFT_508208 [Ilyonectria robusta]|uniref:uncharacterized protein n=1 Tax=Ilyonectria robusta TaxID=1079257 RepID=UPI001E8CE134|nr:uncharacterized protein BGZ61DRAFT_508208 [Ilyonectria robusta]KAH8679360.1 hypothetical protein BGZ61DRAFT_508208 [Ilyonectria robusta]
MDSQQSSILAAEFVTFSMATIFILLRIMSRVVKRVNLWWDDYLAIVCYLMNIVWVAMIPLWLNKGGLGLHVTDITWMTVSEAVSRSKLYLYIGELVYSVALFCAKASLLLFYWRIVSVSSIKLPIQILFGCAVIWVICRIFISIFHCIPVQAYWDLTITDARCDIDDKKFFLGSLIVHVAIDIGIMILPIIQIQKLQLPRLQKIGVIFMFGVGIFICITAIVIMVESTKLDATSSDLTWNLAIIIVWASAEVNLITVSACLPTVRPALAYVWSCGSHETSLGSGSNTYGQSQSKKSIHLSALRKTTGEKGRESGSTYQLADSIRSGDSLTGFDAHASDRRLGVVTSVSPGRDTFESDDNMESGMISGIMVKNETSFRISTQPPPR